MTDPLGSALQYYLTNKTTNESLIIHSEQFDDFEIPLKYFFRNESEMPGIETEALKNCYGSVLDIGGGAGCHALWLMKHQLEVTVIDTSVGAIKTMQSLNINAALEDFWQYKPAQKFDTILMLMNGLGVMGKLSNSTIFFNRLKELLRPAGQVLVDSSDLMHLYMEDGEAFIELSGDYFGESKFCFEFNGEKSEWFDWIYLDFDLLQELALSNDFNCEKLIQNEDGSYLAKLYQSSAK
jgi:hypothetical protein